MTVDVTRHDGGDATFTFSVGGCMCAHVDTYHDGDVYVTTYSGEEFDVFASSWPACFQIVRQHMAGRH